MTHFSIPDSTPEAIATRLNAIRATIPPTTRLIAVSKTKPVEAIRAAYLAGVRDFGESRVQEALEKQEQLQDLPDITWHLIGHLQTNKAAKALNLFQWIHSLDSLKLAIRLNELAAQQSVIPNICLQIKLRPDPNKYGWDADNLATDLPKLDQLTNLNIVGLMVIPPYGLPEDTTRSLFEEAQQLAAQIQKQGYANLTMTELSMGMSEDYPIAVQCGSTMVRLGRVLFGDRA